MDLRATCCSAGFLACLVLISASAEAQGLKQLRAQLERLKLDASLSIATEQDRRAHATAKLSSPALPNDKYVEKRLKLPNKSLGAVAKKAVRFVGPIGAVMAAAEVYDWLFDEDGSITGQPRTFYKPEEELEGWCFKVGYTHGGNCFPTAQSAADWDATQHSDVVSATADIWESGNGATIIQQLEGGGTHHAHSVYKQTYTEPQRVMSDEEMAEAVTDSDDRFRNAPAPQPDPKSVIDDVFDEAEKHPEIQEEYPELKDWLIDLDSELEQAENDPDYEPDFEDPVSDQGPAVQVEVDIPTGCKLLPAVCEIRDWLVQPPEEEPEEPQWEVNVIKPEDLPDAENPLPSAGGSCPSDTITVVGHTIDVPYQPFCDLAVMIKPLVIAGAWMVALFLVVRK